MIEDWEIGMLYFNCLKSCKQDKDIAVQKVKEKYFDTFLKRDLYFFLGTTKEHHNCSKNLLLLLVCFILHSKPPKS